MLLYIDDHERLGGRKSRKEYDKRMTQREALWVRGMETHLPAEELSTLEVLRETDDETLYVEASNCEHGGNACVELTSTS